MHIKNHRISEHPLVQALAASYAKQIKALKEVREGEIEQLYLEFRQKYQCLKQTIEAQEGNSADSLTDSSAAPSNGLSCKSTD